MSNNRRAENRPNRRVAPRRSTNRSRRCPARPSPFVPASAASPRTIRPSPPFNLTDKKTLTAKFRRQKSKSTTFSKRSLDSPFVARLMSERSRSAFSLSLVSRRRQFGRKRPATFRRRRSSTVKRKSTQPNLVPAFTAIPRPTRLPPSSKRRRRRRFRLFFRATPPTPSQEPRATNSKPSLGPSVVGNSKAPASFFKQKSIGRRAAPTSFAATSFARSSRRLRRRRSRRPLPKTPLPRRRRRRRRRPSSRRCASSAGIRSPVSFSRQSFVATEVTEPDFGNAKAKVGALRRAFCSSTGAPRRRSNIFPPARAAVSIGSRPREPSKIRRCPTSVPRRRARSTPVFLNALKNRCLATFLRRRRRRRKASLNKPFSETSINYATVALRFRAKIERPLNAILFKQIKRLF